MDAFRSAGVFSGWLLLSEMTASGLRWFTAAMATTGTPLDRPTSNVGRSPNPNSALPLPTMRSASGVPVPRLMAVTSIPAPEKYPFALATKNGA
jgi:hypothetical protein